MVKVHFIPFVHADRMAGRGRGRGIAAFTFNIEALGLSRGTLPEATLGPRPLFPVWAACFPFSDFVFCRCKVCSTIMFIILYLGVSLPAFQLHDSIYKIHIELLAYM